MLNLKKGIIIDYYSWLVVVLNNSQGAVLLRALDLMILALFHIKGQAKK